MQEQDTRPSLNKVRVAGVLDWRTDSVNECLAKKYSRLLHPSHRETGSYKKRLRPIMTFSSASGLAIRCQSLCNSAKRAQDIQNQYNYGCNPYYLQLSSNYPVSNSRLLGLQVVLGGTRSYQDVSLGNVRWLAWGSSCTSSARLVHLSDTNYI